ncbi:hypothetical protein F4818DRAFT_155284 [Hypoxylon cercidicola]|nr:hypothetical protein F4818DRAFT_155284 [Hypoxylon cercidicola]
MAAFTFSVSARIASSFHLPPLQAAAVATVPEKSYPLHDIYLTSYRGYLYLMLTGKPSKLGGVRTCRIEQMSSDLS